MKSGVLPQKNGLCTEFGEWNYVEDRWEFPNNPLFLLMMPKVYKEGVTSYWASDISAYEAATFGPTRQNIVLLMAAMNNEL